MAASQAGSAQKTALGYADNADLGLSTCAGQNVDATSVLVRYTYYGDANLDGTVDTVDFNFLASNFSGTDKRWNQGDFNYDDTVDFNLLAANFGLTLSAPSAGASIGALVPEPSSIGLIALSCLALRRRRAG